MRVWPFALWLLFAAAMLLVGCPRRHRPVVRWVGQPYLERVCADHGVCL